MANENEENNVVTEAEIGVEDIGQELVQQDSKSSSSRSPSSEGKLSTVLEESTTLGDSAAIPRLAELSRPKKYHLEDTLTKYGHYFEANKVQRMQTQLREQGWTSEVSIQRPSETDEAARKGASKSRKIYENLQGKLRKMAFDTLAESVFAKLPGVILAMEQHGSMQEMPADTTALWQTLHCTLKARLGNPTNEREARMFQHMCFGLTKFVEHIIENVPHEDGDKIRSEEVELGTGMC